ncbi:MAG: hypothetical protein WCQ99_16605 [Pseudomonadota bacterium]
MNWKLTSPRPMLLLRNADIDHKEAIFRAAGDNNAWPSQGRENGMIADD